MIYNLDLKDWYKIQDRLDRDDLDFILHYAEGIGYVGLEFKHQHELEYFLLKYQ